MIYGTSGSLLAGLNDEQMQAVRHVSGPMLVLAGAGTGKTKVLTHRIAFLLSRGVRPENILALTFTRKAGDEMKERVSEIVGDVVNKMQISTFHSLGFSMLREHFRSVGLPRRFRIADRKTRLEVARQLIHKVYGEESMTADDLLAAVSAAKNGLAADSRRSKYR